MLKWWELALGRPALQYARIGKCDIRHSGHRERTHKEGAQKTTHERTCNQTTIRTSERNDFTGVCLQYCARYYFARRSCKRNSSTSILLSQKIRSQYSAQAYIWWFEPAVVVYCRIYGQRGTEHQKVKKYGTQLLQVIALKPNCTQRVANASFPCTYECGRTSQRNRLVAEDPLHTCPTAAYTRGLQCCLIRPHRTLVALHSKCCDAIALLERRYHTTAIFFTIVTGTGSTSTPVTAEDKIRTGAAQSPPPPPTTATGYNHLRSPACSTSRSTRARVNPRATEDQSTAAYHGMPQRNS